MDSLSLLGLRYYAILFAFAFAMGIARVTVVAPHIGATAAVLVEVPIVMAVGWVVSRRLLLGRQMTLSQQTNIGGIVFVLIMASDLILWQLLRGQNVVAWARDVMTPLGLVGLAAQVGVALMPLWATPAVNDLD